MMSIRNGAAGPICALFSLLSACQHAGNASSGAGVLAPVRRSEAAAATRPTQVSAARPALAVETPDPSPFDETVRLGYGARLMVAGERAWLSTQKLLLAIDGDRVQIDSSLLAGLEVDYTAFPRIVGKMPDAAWLILEHYEERTSRSSLWRWSGAEWIHDATLDRYPQLLGVSPWIGGRTLALVGDDYQNKLAFVQLGGAPGLPLPRFAAAPRTYYGCNHGLQPSAMTALPTGEVFLSATACSVDANDEVQTHGMFVEQWSPKQTAGTRRALPLMAEHEAQAGEITSILALRADDVFVAGSRVTAEADSDQSTSQSYLAEFDGRAFRALPAPPTERIEDLQRAPDGTLWVLSNGDLWRARPGTPEQLSWQQVALPRAAVGAAEHSVTSFWVENDRHVWAAIDAEDGSYLVRSGRGTVPLRVPSDVEIARVSKAFEPGAANDCAEPTLVFLTLSRSAQADADLPSVRAALRGHRELEGKARFIELPFLNRRYLGVRGDEQTLEQAREILTRSNIPGLDPTLRCIDAEPSRTLSIDYSGTPLPLAAEAEPPSPLERISHARSKGRLEPRVSPRF